MNEGWMLPREIFEWISQTIPEGANILEFGSGDGSQILSKKYQLWSVEHNQEWVGVSQSNYIFAPIVDNPESSVAGEKGWYDPELFDSTPSRVEVIIIDGPPGVIGRTGICSFLERLPKFNFIIVDDTDRPAEKELSGKIQLFFDCECEEFTCVQVKSNGDSRKFDLLKYTGVD
jgi:hypothetical protein